MILDEMTELRCYIQYETNFKLFKNKSWNAPKVFKHANGVDKSQPIFSKKCFPGSKAFKDRDRNFKMTKNDDGDDGAVVGDDAGADDDYDLCLSQTVTMLYTPILKESGYYCVRYCLDNFEDSDDWYDKQKRKKAFKLSQKSYYYNRYVDPDAKTVAPCSTQGNEVVK